MKSLTKAGTRAVCAGLVVLAAVGWSCSKQDEPSINNQQTVGAIAQARSFYESTATPLTKTVADQSIAIKPLPGDMTPLWDRAAAAVLSDGTTAWVDVPITAGVTYTAVRGGVHHHEAGEECGHDHSSVQAVQKLTIHTAADGTKQSLIATIVPEADCNAVLNDFTSADGLAGFSGFVSWHDLTGKLIRVAKYENGTKTRSVEPDGSNEAAILDVVDKAVLYPVKINPTLSSITTKALPPIPCMYCHEPKCEAKDDRTKHCPMCGKYELKIFPYTSNCICRRCNSCGANIKPAYDKCPTCNKPVPKPEVCKLCGNWYCLHLGNIPGSNPSETSPHIEQAKMLGVILSDKLTAEQFNEVLSGSYAADQPYFQSAGYEYIHGLYVAGYNDEHQTAYSNMRNHFINRAGMFLRYNSYYHLADALHPVLDTYVEKQTRLDMLEYYSYTTMQIIPYNMNLNPYNSDPASCTKAVRYIYNALVTLGGSATDDQIASVFDHWVDMSGGVPF